MEAESDNLERPPLTWKHSTDELIRQLLERSDEQLSTSESTLTGKSRSIKQHLFATGMRLLLASQVWLNALPTRKCDVVLLVPDELLLLRSKKKSNRNGQSPEETSPPKSIQAASSEGTQDSKYCDISTEFSDAPQQKAHSSRVLKWIIDTLSKDSRIKIEAHHSVYTKSTALHITAQSEDLLKGADALQMRKMLKEEFGGGLKDFVYKDADCFFGARDRQFLTSQERSLIVYSFLNSIRASVDDSFIHHSLPTSAQSPSIEGSTSSPKTISKRELRGTDITVAAALDSATAKVAGSEASTATGPGVAPSPLSSQAFLEENLQVQFLESPAADKSQEPTVEDWAASLRFRNGELVLPVLRRNKLVTQMFPLHNEIDLANLKQRWVWNFMLPQPMDEICDYFGERIGMYFAWLGHYTTALSFPAVLGVGHYLFLSGRSQIADDIVIVSFAVVNILWSTLYLESWKRRQAELAYQWGTLSMETDLLQEPRPEFKGTLMKSPVTGRLETYYPPWRRKLFRYVISYPVTGLCILTMFLIMLTVFELQEWVTAEFGTSFYWGWLTLCPKVLLAVIVILADDAYGRLAEWLNDCENYRTDEAYENHLIIKTVVFQFVNSFLSLFYIAFYLVDFQRLRTQLATLLITRLIIGNLKEAILPLLIEKIKLSRLTYNMTKSMDRDTFKRHVDEMKEQRSELLSKDPITPGQPSSSSTNFVPGQNLFSSLESIPGSPNSELASDDNVGSPLMSPCHSINNDDNIRISTENSNISHEISCNDVESELRQRRTIPTPNELQLASRSSKNQEQEAMEKIKDSLRSTESPSSERHIDAISARDVTPQGCSTNLDQSQDIPSHSSTSDTPPSSTSPTLLHGKCSPGKLAEKTLFSNQDAPSLTQAEVESIMPVYTSPLQDYLEMYIQFGLVLLFGPAFPLAAVCALLNNLVEIHVDAFKLTSAFQRPFGRRVETIGAWQPAMELMGVAGVIVNCALIGTSGVVRRLWPGLSVARQIAFIVVLEHIILAGKLFLAFAIPDIPHWVTVEQAKVEYKRRAALRTIEGRVMNIKHRGRRARSTSEKPKPRKTKTHRNI